MYAHSFDTEYQVARRLARAAGTAAMRHYGSLSIGAREAGVSPVTIADRESNEVILGGLREAFPRDAVLSEEAPDSRARLTHERVWMVDPLDGTKEFIAQNGEFAVMIGLAVAGVPVLGAIYLPVLDVLYSAAWGAGAWVEWQDQVAPLRARAAERASLRLITSRSHADPLVKEIQRALDITDARVSGSVGVKCALIAEGTCDLYVHPGPYLKEWDTCAPDIVLREAGGSVTDCYGEPLRYNKPSPLQPHGFVACAPGVFDVALPVIPPLYATANAVAPQ